VPFGATGAFSRALAVPGPAGLTPWTVSLSGTATPAGVQLSFQAGAGAAGGESCTIGPLAGLTFARLPVVPQSA
jgi:hypothetical protein